MGAKLNDNQLKRIQARKAAIPPLLDEYRDALEAAREPRKEYTQAKRALENAREKGRPAERIRELRTALLEARSVYLPLSREVTRTQRRLNAARKRLAEQRIIERQRARDRELRRARNADERRAAKAIDLSDPDELATVQAEMGMVLLSAGIHTEQSDDLDENAAEESLDDE